MQDIIIKYSLNKKETATVLIDNYSNGIILTISISEIKQIIKLFEYNILNGQYTISLNCLILGLLYDSFSILEYIKRKGLFRYSKFIGKKCIVNNLCENIIALSSELKLPKEAVDYFSSVKSLSCIRSILAELRFDILLEIRHFNIIHSHDDKSFVKTLLVYLDYLFFISHNPDERIDPNRLSFYTKETISTAISFIFYLYFDSFGMHENSFGQIDEEYILSNKIESLVLNACYFKKLQEFEIYIDHFSYRCVLENNKLRILPPNPEFEKSIRLGYVRNELQWHISNLNFRSSAVSIEQICDKLLKKSNFDLLKFTDSPPYPRYRIEIPNSLISSLGDDFFSKDILFKEEEALILHSIKEQFLDLKRLYSIKLKDDLLFSDLLKIRRLLIFLYTMFIKCLKKNSVTDPALILRSLVPGFSSKDAFYKIFENIVSREIFESFLDLFSWNTDQHIPLDLQYQSLIKLGDIYLVPINLFAHSNLIRNLFSLEYKLNNPEIFDNGNFDLISESLSKVFTKKGFKTFNKLKYDFDKGSGDIDFMAVKENMIFIAECKNSLLPTDIFELRTLYDSLRKASEQLDQISEALKNANFKKNLGESIRYDLSKIESILPSIITTTRPFVGLNLFKYPIRNVQEVLNIVDTGIIKANDTEYSVWQNDTFSLSDLTQYFTNFAYHQCLLDSMSENDISYNIKSKIVNMVTYSLNIIKTSDNIKKLNYRKT